MSQTVRPVSAVELDEIVKLILSKRRGGFALLLLSYAGLVLATWAFIDNDVAWVAMATFGLLPAALIWLSFYRRIAAWWFERQVRAQGFADDVARDVARAYGVARDNLVPTLRDALDQHGIPTPEEPTPFEQTQQPTRTLDEGEGWLRIVFRATTFSRWGSLVFAAAATVGTSIPLALDIREAGGLEGEDAIKVVVTVIMIGVGLVAVFFGFRTHRIGVEDGHLFRGSRIAGRDVGLRRLPVGDVVRVRLDKRREAGPQPGVHYTVYYVVVDAPAGEEEDWYRSMDLSLVAQVAAALRRALPPSTPSESAAATQRAGDRRQAL